MAPLDAGVVDIPAYKGLAESQDAYVLQPGGLLTADNVVATRSGALDKRNGFAAMPSTVVNGSYVFPSTWHKLFTVGGELCAIGQLQAADGGTPAVWSYAPGRGGWAMRDDVTPCTVRRAPLTRSSITQQNGSVSYGNGLLVSWWALSNAGVYLRVIDATTGAVVVNDVQVSTQTGAQIAVFQVGAYSVCAFAASSGTSNLFTITYNTATGVTSSVGTLVASLIDRFDACPIDGASDRFGVVWTTTASRTNLNIAVVDVVSQGVLRSVTFPSGAVIDCLTVTAKASARLYAFFHDSTGNSLQTGALDELTLGSLSTGSVLAGATSCYRLGAGIDASGNAVLLFDGATAAGQATKRFTVNTSAGVASSIPSGYNTRLWSRPFRASDGRMYAVMGAYDGRTHVVTRVDHVDGYRIAAIPLRGFSITPPTGGLDPTTVVSPMTSSRYAYAAAVVTQVVGSSQEAINSDVVTLDFGAPQAALWGALEAQGCALLTGGATQSYDGQCTVENGYACISPPLLSAVQTSTGSGGMGPTAPATSVTYLYCATLEWTDAKGNIHVSQPTPALTRTVDNTHDAVTLTLKTLALTDRGNASDGAQRNVRLHLFRTKGNSSGPFYRVTRRTSGPGDPDYLLNDKTVAAVTYLDTKSDTQLESTGAGFLYTDGGILENLPAPPSLAACVHKGRVWLVSAEDARRVYYSKLLTPTEPPSFNEALYLRLDDAPEEATALASLDDKLAVFTPSRVYLVTGDGPDDTGLNGQFSAPQLITANAGCIDPRSIATFSGGVFFQSAMGLCLLGRDGSVSFAGNAVQTTLGEGKTVLATAHDRSRGRLSWVVDGVPPRVVVYDYSTDVWTTWSFTSGNTSALVEWSNTLVRGASDIGSGFFRESQGATPGYDDTTWIVSDLRSPWIDLAGQAGYQRVRRLTFTGRNLSSHKLRVRIYTDFDAGTVKQTMTFDLTASPLAGLSAERLQVHLNAAVQKCSSIMVRITDLTPGSTSSSLPAGCAFVSMSLEIGRKKGSAKLPVAQKG